MNKNVLLQITSCCERELTLRASERLLTRMYQYVCLEGTSLCAFVFALIAAERLFSSMNTHMLFQISIKNGGVETHGASVGFLSSLLYFGLGCETHCSKFSEKLTATRQLDLPMANFFFLASSVLYQSFGSTGRNYYFPDGYKKKSGAACVLKLSAREDAKSHCLHLFCLSPLCVFKCVLK